jgi:hypothetical protein
VSASQAPTLLADVLGVGARYREVVVYPEYVLAYQWCEGTRSPLS